MNVPSWSADDTKVYFSSLGNGGYSSVSWSSPDGPDWGHLRGPGDASISNAVWSTDGGRVAFMTGMPDGNGYSVDVMNADGSGHRILIRSLPGYSAVPIDWSPDNTRLLLSIAGPSGFEMVVINADGTGQKTVREDAIADAWSPDGSRLLFHKNSDRRLWTIRVDGSGERSVGDLTGDADWGPGTVDPDPATGPPPTTRPPTAAPVPPPLSQRPPYPEPRSTASTSVASVRPAATRSSDPASPPPPTAPSPTLEQRTARLSLLSAEGQRPTATDQAAAEQPASAQSVGPTSVAAIALLLTTSALTAQSCVAAFGRRREQT